MLAEDNVLPRLAASRDGEGQPFLLPHHLLAAARFERLIDRARLVPRVTISYDPASVGGRGRSGNGSGEATDRAADARQKLNRLAASIPSDCWGVMFDICGLGKGLQAIETERRWPRRSAKLVLRIGLEQLAGHFGLEPQATGNERAPTQAWLTERLPIVPDRPL